MLLGGNITIYLEGEELIVTELWNMAMVDAVDTRGMLLAVVGGLDMAMTLREEAIIIKPRKVPVSVGLLLH